MTKIGSSTSASSVICHDIPSITTSVSTSITRLLTTPDSVSLNARCAPITSLFSRQTSAPVRVRVKKAIGIRWTWSNTAVRRSRISPSPILADSQRVSRPSPASATAITAISTASRSTTLNALPPTIASTTRPASTGVATARTARADAEHQERDQLPPVRPREGEDAFQRRARERAFLVLGVHRVVHRRPRGHFHTHG